MTSTRYETIGRTYSATRRTDPRLAAYVHAAIGDARTVCNLGAGAGSYEPDDRSVVAVDPSLTMIRQRPPGAAPVVQAMAEALPFADHAFDAAMGVLTVHHWTDLASGLAEMRRVARRQVLFFFESSLADRAWIVADYFPDVLDLESERNAPGAADLARHLDVVRVEAVPVPADCVDGFAGCYWNRPEQYLDAEVQAGMSSFAQMEPAARARGMQRLAAELASGEWDAKYGHLRALTEYELGYRILTAGLAL